MNQLPIVNAVAPLAVVPQPVPAVTQAIADVGPANFVANIQAGGREVATTVSFAYPQFAPPTPVSLVGGIGQEALPAVRKLQAEWADWHADESHAMPSVQAFDIVGVPTQWNDPAVQDDAGWDTLKGGTALSWFLDDAAETVTLERRHEPIAV